MSNVKMSFVLFLEVLAGPVGDNSTSHWYDFPGDMYGLGLVIVELWCQTLDVFQEVRNSLIKSWRAQENPGTQCIIICLFKILCLDISSCKIKIT